MALKPELGVVIGCARETQGFCWTNKERCATAAHARKTDAVDSNEMFHPPVIRCFEISSMDLVWMELVVCARDGNEC